MGIGVDGSRNGCHCREFYLIKKNRAQKVNINGTARSTSSQLSGQ